MEPRAFHPEELHQEGFTGIAHDGGTNTLPELSWSVWVSGWLTGFYSTQEAAEKRLQERKERPNA